MNNMSSYCGLIDAKIRASNKDLPVRTQIHQAIPKSVPQKIEYLLINYMELNI